MADISTKDVSKWIKMEANEFERVGKYWQGAFPRVHVVEVPGRGYAILGPTGAYVQEDGSRLVESLSEARHILKWLGVELAAVKGKAERFDLTDT